MAKRKSDKPREKVIRCGKNKPCPTGMICDPIEKRCVKRKAGDNTQRAILAGEKRLVTVEEQAKLQRKLDLAEKKRQHILRLAAEEAKRLEEKRIELAKKLREIQQRAAGRKIRDWFEKYKSWEKSPGQPGFNEYAYARMKEDNLFGSLRLGCTPNTTQAYQTTVGYLVRRQTNINRLLCVHRTGSGKTRSMILVLDNFFRDPRPKVVIFPNEAVKQNFYSEIMKFESKYRDYVISKLGAGIVAELGSSSRATSNAARKKVHDVLAMTGSLRRAGQPGYLAAPLRAYRYSIVGGSTVFSASGPKDPVFKQMYDKQSRNPFTNKIILMDEVHNLVHLEKDMKKYESKIQRVRDGLYSSKNSVVVGFTATPFINHRKEGEDLLKIIKGSQHQSSNDEGFVSYFNSLPPALYPVIVPEPKHSVGIELPFVVGGETLKKYMEKTKKVKCADDNLQACSSLQNYVNMSTAYTHFKTSGKNGDWLSRVKADPESHGLKIMQLIDHIQKANVKTLILVERAAGFKAFEAAFTAVAKENGMKCPDKCWTSVYEKSKSKHTIDEFNAPDNLRGEKILTMIADAKEFSEGISFFGVRSLYLLNPPLSYGRYEQQIGRALRSCAYSQLAANQRNISIFIAVGKLEGGEPSIDDRALTSMKEQKTVYDHGMARFRDVAADERILKKYFGISQ